MTPMPTAGRFCWHELMTTDPDGAAAFYARVAGWSQQQSPNTPGYRLWINPGDPMGVAGSMQLPEQARQMGTPSHWLPYVEVLDVDATVRQATALGARTYVSPRDIPTVGRFAVLADPEGAIFGVYKDMKGLSPDGEPQRGEFCWHEMIADHPDKAWTFYATLFNWEKREAMDMGPAGVYQIFRNIGGSRDIGGMYRRPPEMPGGARWLCYFIVSSVDQTAGVVTKNGGTMVLGPMDVPGGGRILNAVDPQGAGFASLSQSAPAKKAPKKSKAKPRKKPVKKKPARKAKLKKKPAKKAKKRR